MSVTPPSTDTSSHIALRRGSVARESSTPSEFLISTSSGEGSGVQVIQPNDLVVQQNDFVDKTKMFGLGLGSGIIRMLVSKSNNSAGAHGRNVTNARADGHGLGGARRLLVAGSQIDCEALLPSAGSQMILELKDLNRELAKNELPSANYVVVQVNVSLRVRFVRVRARGYRQGVTRILTNPNMLTSGKWPGLLTRSLLQSF